jgi:ribosomal protein L9
MELILKKDVQNVGFKDDLVTVKTDTVVTFNSTRTCI